MRALKHISLVIIQLFILSSLGTDLSWALAPAHGGVSSEEFRAAALTRTTLDGEGVRGDVLGGVENNDSSETVTAVEKSKSSWLWPSVMGGLFVLGLTVFIVGVTVTMTEAAAAAMILTGLLFVLIGLAGAVYFGYKSLKTKYPYIVSIFFSFIGFAAVVTAIAGLAAEFMIVAAGVLVLILGLLLFLVAFRSWRSVSKAQADGGDEGGDVVESEDGKSVSDPIVEDDNNSINEALDESSATEEERANKETAEKEKLLALERVEGVFNTVQDAYKHAQEEIKEARAIEDIEVEDVEVEDLEIIKTKVEKIKKALVDLEEVIVLEKENLAEATPLLSDPLFKEKVENVAAFLVEVEGFVVKERVSLEEDIARVEKLETNAETVTRKNQEVELNKAKSKAESINESKSSSESKSTNKVVDENVTPMIQEQPELVDIIDDFIEEFSAPLSSPDPYVFIPTVEAPIYETPLRDPYIEKIEADGLRDIKALQERLNHIDQAYGDVRFGADTYKPQARVPRFVPSQALNPFDSIRQWVDQKEAEVNHIIDQVKHVAATLWSSYVPVNAMKADVTAESLAAVEKRLSAQTNFSTLLENRVYVEAGLVFAGQVVYNTHLKKVIPVISDQLTGALKEFVAAVELKKSKMMNAVAAKSEAEYFQKSTHKDVVAFNKAVYAHVFTGYRKADFQALTLALNEHLPEDDIREVGVSMQGIALPQTKDTIEALLGVAKFDASAIKTILARKQMLLNIFKLAEESLPDADAEFSASMLNKPITGRIYGSLSEGLGDNLTMLSA